MSIDSSKYLPVLPAVTLTLLPAVAAAATGGPAGEWSSILAAGLAAALAAAAVALIAMGRRIAHLSRQGAAAARRAEHDVSESSQALAEARDAAGRAADRGDGFKAMLDALPLPVWRRRADLDLDWCNAAYAAAVGDAAAKAVESGLELAAGVIDREGRGLAERARDTRRTQSESHPVVVDGARRLFDFTEQPLGAGTLGYAQDGTGIEQTQQELARHIAAHGEVLERLGSAIAIFGADTRLKFFNRSYVQIWGLEESWLRDEPSLGEVLEALRERRRLPEVADFQAFKQGQLKLFRTLMEPTEETIYRPDDTTIRQVLAPHPFGGLIFISEDVTERLALERSYDTLSAVQQETISRLQEGVAVFGSDGRLKLWNPAFAQLWDLTPEELDAGPHVSDLAEKAKRFFTRYGDWPTVKAKLLSHVIEPESRSGQFERADGSVLDYALVPLPDGACLMSYVDVTDTIRVERALRDRSEALETADRLKSEFIANVSYQLRTPLTVILGFTEVLANKYFGSLNEKQAEYADGILESSKQLLALINDILDLATIEAGHMQLELAPVDVRQLLEDVLALNRSRAGDVGVTLELDCPADFGALVADQRRLKQAIFNLVSNAVKFTDAGGTVTMSGRREGAGSAEQVVLEVADTGTGVAEADQAQVFDKFHRVDPQARGSGPGLGLSLVKSFIELHGGQVEFISSAGAGTRVLCRVPSRSSERDDAQAPIGRDRAAEG